MKIKVCSVCKSEKDIRNFYKKYGKHIASCMDCYRAKVTRRYQLVIRPRRVEERRILERAS